VEQRGKGQKEIKHSTPRRSSKILQNYWPVQGFKCRFHL